MSTVKDYQKLEISGLRELAQKLHSQLSEANQKIKDISALINEAHHYGGMPFYDIQSIKKIVES